MTSASKPGQARVAVDKFTRHTEQCFKIRNVPLQKLLEADDIGLFPFQKRRNRFNVAVHLNINGNNLNAGTLHILELKHSVLVDNPFRAIFHMRGDGAGRSGNNIGVHR